MRQRVITDESWTEAGAMHLVRNLADNRRAMPPIQAEEAGRRAVLTRTVESEVFPRLLMVPRPEAMPRVSTQTQATDDTQVTRLVDMVLAGSQTEASGYVEAMHEAGTPIESLLLDLLTPAARLLGRMWEDDTCTFSDVTIGLLRLGNVMRRLERAFTGDTDQQHAGPTALLVQMPGEQHGFGLAMVVQFFRRAGWHVRQEPVVTSAELVGIVHKDWFGLVGLSVSCNDRLDSLAADIRAIRRHSRNRSIGVMVGGPPFVAHPQLAAMVGADATAVDAKQAVSQARSLVSQLARQG